MDLHPGAEKEDREQPAVRPAASGRGLRVERQSTRAGEDVYAQVPWELRTASIVGPGGREVFRQEDVEVPSTWSPTATNVVASKYFRGGLGTPERERSVRNLIGRVARTITDWGRDDGYFLSKADAVAFHDELVHLLLHQKMAFNSPVWFNVGVEKDPQCSACFILSVEDTMSSILDLAKTEGMLFKWGSGTGSNLSVLRGSREPLAGGGLASGPVSFMRGFDAFAGAIKSGGKTRRAAKMVVLNADHPDIREFIWCKAKEERKAKALIAEGYDPGFDAPGGAYESVFFQNANHSVRVTDSFLRAALEEQEWFTRAVTTGEALDRYRADELLNEIAEAAWECGDPGLQFDTVINRWHKCKASGRINASNPCSEYMFLDDTACNLASLNLMKFRTPDGELDAGAFVQAVGLSILAQEIIVDRASYPTPEVTKNSRRYRTLGLGYANLGALLMARGLPYDSDEGRAYAAAVTALMTGSAYRQSALIAASRGAFETYEKNASAMLEVIDLHCTAAGELEASMIPPALLRAARRAWDDAREQGAAAGFRNAQVTVIAPTGTIGFMMDCDTTGIEPDIALVKYKRLVGGGVIKMVNRTVPEALERLGYDAEEIRSIAGWIEENDTIEGAPGLKDENLPVFDCAFRPAAGNRSIDWRGHIAMMGAVQPFLSGAISKTVNLPHDASIQDVREAYVLAWKLGCKSISIYRDGCKQTQPLSTRMEGERAMVSVGQLPQGVRRRLPDEREAITHKFDIVGHKGYVTVGLYEDGIPGEIFIKMSKEGSTVAGLMDSFAIAVSFCLQYGVPLGSLIRQFKHTRFEPSGITQNPEIRFASSITDYIFRWLELRFGEKLRGADAGEASVEALPADAQRRLPLLQVHPGEGTEAAAPPVAPIKGQADAPACYECGALMYRSGSCYKCANCGASPGCS